MAIFKIKDGFSIVDSNNVESQQISGVATAISSDPSDSNIPTEKAVADAIAAGGGGGGGGDFIEWTLDPRAATQSTTFANNRSYSFAFIFPKKMTPKKLILAPSSALTFPITVRAAIAVNTWLGTWSPEPAYGDVCYYGEQTFSDTTLATGGAVSFGTNRGYMLEIPLTHKAGKKETWNCGENALVVINTTGSFSVCALGNGSLESMMYNTGTISSSTATWRAFGTVVTYLPAAGIVSA